MKYTATFKKVELRKVLPDLYLTFNGFDFGLIDTLKIRDII